MLSNIAYAVRLYGVSDFRAVRRRKDGLPNVPFLEIEKLERQRRTHGIRSNEPLSTSMKNVPEHRSAKIRKRTGRDDKVSRNGYGVHSAAYRGIRHPFYPGHAGQRCVQRHRLRLPGAGHWRDRPCTATVAMPIMTVFAWPSPCSWATAVMRWQRCAWARGNRVEARRSLGNNSVPVSRVRGDHWPVLMHIPACVNALLGVSGATAEDWEYARLVHPDHLRWASCFQCIGMGVNNFIRYGRRTEPRAGHHMIIGAVSCTVFNFLFVMVLGWGVQGSALATVRPGHLVRHGAVVLHRYEERSYEAASALLAAASAHGAAGFCRWVWPASRATGGHGRGELLC